jgi:hypothetical protein
MRIGETRNNILYLKITQVKECQNLINDCFVREYYCVIGLRKPVCNKSNLIALLINCAIA